MKTKLLFIFLLAFSFGNAQINISEGFESGGLPSGWVNSGFNFFNNPALATSGNYYASANSAIGSNQFITTSSQTSNGNPMYVSIKVRKQAGISGFASLNYSVGASTALNQIALINYGTPYSAYQTLSGTIPAGTIPSGTSIKFVIRVSGNAGTASAVMFDDFLVITNSTLGPLITDVSNTPFTNSATIAYSLNAFNAATTSVVKYGLTSSNLSSQVTGFSASGNALTSNNVSITGLTPQTQYYYQIEATNSAGTTTSAIGTFTTSMPIADYNFNNTYNNVNGNTPFSSRVGTTSLVVDRNGNPNSALQVIGNYAYGSNVALQLPSGNSVRTISFWYKSYVTGNGSSLFNYGVAQQYQNFGAYFGATGNIVFWGNNYDSNFGGTYPALVWRHLVMVYDGSNVKLYLDGSLVNSIARPLVNTSTAGFLQLGNSTGATIDFDDLKIYNYELSQTEVTNLYNYNQIENPTPPVISNISEIPTTSTVTINYTLNTISSSATSLIKYGLTDTSLTSQNSGFSTNNTATNGVTINGLLPNTTYYYQIESTNNLGTTLSSIESFTTLTEQTIAEYSFDNTYNNVLGSAPFASNTNTSFTTDRHNNANAAINLTSIGNSLGTTATIPNLSYSNAPRTISFWVKLNNYDTGSFINPVFYYGTLSNDNMFGGTVDYGETSVFGYNNNYTVTTTNNLLTWYHYVYVYDGTTAKIYKDGVLLGSQAKSWNTINDNNLFRIGTSFAGAGSFSGVIDDLKIYNYVLSDTEISNLHTNNTLSSSDFSQNNLEVALYPNPVRDVLNIETVLDIQSVEIYNIQGQKVLSSNQKQINVSDLAAGMYMVRIQDADNNIATKKVIIK